MRKKFYFDAACFFLDSEEHCKFLGDGQTNCILIGTYQGVYQSFFGIRQFYFIGTCSCKTHQEDCPSKMQDTYTFEVRGSWHNFEQFQGLVRGT